MKIDFNYLNSLGDGKKIAVYDVNANEHLRFIAPYEGKFYVLFWLEISSDGSVCCGVRDLKAKKYSSGVIQSQNGTTTLDWGNVPELIETESPEKLKKMTFHTSGKIHGVKYGEVTHRRPFNELKSQEELFIAIFREPSEYEEIKDTARKKDICILSEIPQGHPIFLQTFIAPKDKFCDVSINNGQYQYSAILECNGIPNVGDIIIQMCFSFSDKSSYPPYSFMAWPTQNDNK